MSFILIESLVWLLALVMTVLVVGLHIKALRYAGFMFGRGKPNNIWHIFRGTAYILILHNVEMLMFGLIFYVSCEWYDFGALINADNFVDYLYFSAASYTSLGFGDIYPHGPMRLFAGIEALVGLIMIGWTVAFTYNYALTAHQRRA